MHNPLLFHDFPKWEKNNNGWLHSLVIYKYQSRKQNFLIKLNQLKNQTVNQLNGVYMMRSLALTHLFPMHPFSNP